MTDEISSKDRENIQSVIKDLKLNSLLREDETVNEGFFTVLVSGFASFWNRGAFCYVLLTQEKLILIKKKFLSKPTEFELIPFESIKELFFTKLRNILHLVMGLGYLAMGPVFFVLILPLIYSGMLTLPLLNVLFWLLVVASGFFIWVGIFILYRFITGKDMIFLEIPEEKLVMYYKYSALKPKGNVTFFKIPENNLQIQTKRANLEDLYDLLNELTECKGYKIESFQYIPSETNIPERVQKRIHYLRPS